MTKRTRRNQSPKAKVAIAAIKGGRRRLSWHSCTTSTPTRSRPGRRNWLKPRSGLRSSRPADKEAAPTVDLKGLHAKIGELTVENDFLAGALGKAGLLSAKR